GRQGHVAGLFLARLHADDGGLYLRVHAARAEHGAGLLDAFGRHALAVDHAVGLDVDQVVLHRRALHLAPAAALLAQVVEHAVDVGVGHFRGVADDLELGHVEFAELGHQLDRGDVLQLALGRFLVLVDLRDAGDAQFVLADRLVHALAQQVVDDLGAHLAAEALLDHLGGHLAGTEALDAGGAGDLAQAAADLVGDVAGGQAEDDAALEVAGGFDRDLHDAMTPGRARGGPGLRILDAGWPRAMARAERTSFADSRPAVIFPARPR